MRLAEKLDWKGLKQDSPRNFVLVCQCMNFLKYVCRPVKGLLCAIPLSYFLLF